MSRSDSEVVLEFPGEEPLGDLYSRRRGLKRWNKVGPATGRVVLDPSSEYKLRLFNVAVAPMQVVGSLAGVNCNLLAEIEAPLAVPERDLMDQALSGVHWLKRAIEREQAKVKEALNTSARLIFALTPIDFSAFE